MILKKLTLRNFKGIKDFTFEPNGESAIVYGANGTGKTTTMDAFLWLITDKDSENNVNFSIKTIDPKAEQKKGIDHEVEGVFDIEGVKLTLKKVFQEKWTKKRGFAKATFSGNTTVYFIDGVPAKKKEYTAKTEEIADPVTFKLLTNPRYVNEEMKWEDRRELLIAICGDVSNAEVVAINPELSGVEKLLADRTIEDNRKVIMGRRKKINEELDTIPVRIDELNSTFEELPPENDTKAKNETIKAELIDLQKKVATIETGGAVGLKEKELLDVRNKIQEIEIKQKKEIADAQAKEADAIRALEVDLSQNRMKLSSQQEQFESTNKQIEKNKSAIKEKIELWHRENKKQFTPPTVDAVCPTCGQEIPKEKIQATMDAAMKLFNSEKATTLKTINDAGKALVESTKSLKSEVEELEEGIKALTGIVTMREKQISELKKAAKNRPAPEPSKEHQTLIESANKLESELSELKIGSHDETDGLKAQIAELEAEAEKVRSLLAKHEASNNAKERIETLKQREKGLAAEFEKCEEELNLLETFIREKCDLLTEKINSHFEMTEWKLFEDQLNGGLRDCCIAMVNGVPYPDLNTAARINCGIDIVNALSKHYGIQMPMFIDHAESVTHLIDTDSQRICLVVSEKDEALRVETAQKELSNAA